MSLALEMSQLLCAADKCYRAVLSMRLLQSNLGHIEDSPWKRGISELKWNGGKEMNYAKINMILFHLPPLIIETLVSL